MQHDMNIANQGFPAFRADLNDALVALVSNNSGASAPATTFANMPWYDTTNNIFKIRNEDNDAWISVFTLDQTTDAITAIGSVTLADVVSLTGTQTLTNKTLTNPILTNPTVDKITTGVSGAIIGAGNSSLMKNRIINGAMVIDQRNAGASINPSNGQYNLDRWVTYAAQSSKFTVQQNAGLVTPPVGFTKYLGITSSSAYSSISTDYFGLMQKIEGFNIADLGWGTANAKTVTLSFQVYSSLTGTFSGALLNSAENRSYPFTFTVSSANTWTTASVTIAGDTTGTWATDSSAGLEIVFNLGSGSTRLGTAGSWSANGYLGATGSVSVVGTNGATFYITGVQLEVGSSATGFEYVNYQTSLANCQRYYQVGAGAISGWAGSSTTMGGVAQLLQTPRSAPTVATSTAGGANYSGSPTVGTPTTTYFPITIGTNGVSANAYYQFTYTASSEL